MTMTALAVISPVVATTRLSIVVACVPNSFHQDCSCFSFLVLVIIFDSTPKTRFWGGNFEGMCLFVGSGLLHRGTPQWTDTWHKSCTLVSLNPSTSHLTNAALRREQEASIVQLRCFREELVTAAWRNQQLARNPVRFYSLHHYPLPIP